MAFLIRVYYHFLFFLVTANLKQQQLLKVTDATRMTKSNYNIPLRPSLVWPNLTVQHSSLLWLWRMEGLGRHNVRWWTSFAVICCRQKQKNATRVHATSSEFSFCFRRAAGCDWVGQNQGSCDSTLVVVKRSNYRCIHLHTGSGERMRNHYREQEDDGDAPVLSNHKR